MKLLLQTFSLEDIVLYTVLVLLAFKGVVSFLEWLSNWGIKFINSRYQKPKELQQVVYEMSHALQTLSTKVDMLIDSDKDDIKAFITREHHYFCYQKGWIDDHSLDCIEKRYSHYKDEGGNSFISTLMEEIRNLPKQQSKEKIE